MIEVIVGGIIVAIVAGGAFALYRLGGSKAREQRQKEKADDAEAEKERLAAPRKHGRSLADFLRGKR